MSHPWKNKVKHSERKKNAGDELMRFIDKWDHVCPVCKKPAIARMHESKHVRFKHVVVKKKEPTSDAQRRSPHFNGSTSKTTTSYCYISYSGEIIK